MGTLAANLLVEADRIFSIREIDSPDPLGRLLRLPARRPHGGVEHRG